MHAFTPSRRVALVAAVLVMAGVSGTTRADITLTTVANLSTFTTGGSPDSGPTLDAAGNLYGTTSNGGPNGGGVIFKVAVGSGVATNLAAFNGTNGASPYGSLVFDPVGNLFGTTQGGGANGLGSIFEVARGTSTIKTLFSLGGPGQGY